ncbi:hypothetical protein [Flavobacterium sp.]|nr:hypothetical protein [Flavobacterium sp.]
MGNSIGPESAQKGLEPLQTEFTGGVGGGITAPPAVVVLLIVAAQPEY